MASHIKCPECGVFNTNKEFCTNCGALLSSEKRRELAFQKAEKERQQRRQLEKKNDPSFYDRYKDHRFWIVRVFAKITRSIWLVFMAIGVFIAWIITAIAA
ncbi:hypothetical protein [Sediminibacter sp. Hel_I_10]|uniref:hypothetical protein n=1 Tax=Sediminibacter sp. Hel_I_10 TaxID=1392490 RepID=UPI00047A1D64|nr:hypothetical protein [Sediminibacter sp. Hel_I_10]